MKYLILLFIISTNSFAGFNAYSEKRIQDYFDILSYEKTNFEPDGAVCERVAEREFEKYYPKENYTIINSIHYNDKKTTIGELDLVIFDKQTDLVKAIAEVKCWTNFQSALKKAKDQRIRFQTYLNHGIVISDNDGKRYSKDQFKSVEKYFTISQDGGVNQGFDFELSLTLKEFVELRNRLLICKSEGRCPKR